MSRATYHALLVGVDRYHGKRPLGGCVNDVDAIQRILLGDRMAIPAGHVRRLVSPLPGADHASEIPEQPATLANLRSELADLATCRVQPDDRVFIYFAGHGTRLDETGPAGERFHREALVPADYDPQAAEARLLCDFELNEALRAILLRTRQVSLVLDCCYAAGAVRSAHDPEDWRPRCLEVPQSIIEPSPELAQITGAAPDAEIGRVNDCHVVAACLGHQRAYEMRGSDGVRRGLLTRALLSAIDDATDVDLRSVAWGRLWQVIHAGVQQFNPGQHPMMIGHPARAVFGGMPTSGDLGIPISRDGDMYKLAAGAMASITPRTKVAVYGERPEIFWPLDSIDDLQDRLGVVEVTKATHSSATAIRDGRAFALPHGARGRVIRPGDDARLRCAVRPPNASLETLLRASPLLEMVTDPAPANVRLEHCNGRWYVTDDVHGLGVDGDGPILCALWPADLPYARDVLEHYYRYSRPIAMAARATDLPGGLDLRVLRATERQLPGSRAQTPGFPEAPTRGRGSYAVPLRAHVCFEVRNRSYRQLRVSLLNAAASGRVQLLGDEVIDPGHGHVFWANNSVGTPFEMTPPPAGGSHFIDRAVAIGRTAVGHGLEYLQVEQTFAGVVANARVVHRGMLGGRGPEQWTAAQVVIETGGPPGS